MRNPGWGEPRVACGRSVPHPGHSPGAAKRNAAPRGQKILWVLMFLTDVPNDFWPLVYIRRWMPCAARAFAFARCAEKHLAPLHTPGLPAGWGPHMCGPIDSVCPHLGIVKDTWGPSTQCRARGGASLGPDLAEWCPRGSRGGGTPGLLSCSHERWIHDCSWGDPWAHAY